jgi:hypothetical protein
VSVTALGFAAGAGDGETAAFAVVLDAAAG